MGTGYGGWMVGRRCRPERVCSRRRVHFPGRCRAVKSGAIRRCPATVRPQQGTSQVERSAPSETSALGGRAVRAAAAAGPPPSADAEVFHVRTDDPAASTLEALGPESGAAGVASGHLLRTLVEWWQGLGAHAPDAAPPEEGARGADHDGDRYLRPHQHARRRRELLARQADTLGIALVEIRIPPTCPKGVYEARMAQAFASPPLSGVAAVAFGDLFLEDVRAYREARLASGGKRGLFPLWGVGCVNSAGVTPAGRAHVQRARRDERTWRAR
jgi:hypothetical protein